MIPPAASPGSEDRGTVAEEFVATGGAGYLVQFLNMLKGFLVVRLLGPTNYGIWNLLKMLIYSSEYASGGATYAMAREVPYNLGRRAGLRNRLIQAAVLNLGVAISGLLALGALLGSFLPIFTEVALELRMAALAAFLMYPVYFAKERFYSEGRLLLLSRYQVALAGVGSGLGVALLLLWGLRGLLLSVIATCLILGGYLVASGALPIARVFPLRLIRRLVGFGFPFLVVSFAFTLMQNIDALIVAAVLGATQTGYYGLAAFITATVHQIPLSLSGVLFPRMMFDLGRTGDPRLVERYYRLPSRLLATGMPLLLGLVFLHLEWPIRLLLPEYLPALPALRVLTIGTAFSVLTLVPIDLMMAFRKQGVLLRTVGGTLLAGALADYAMVRAGYGIAGVAAMTAGAFLLLAALLNLQAMRLFGRGFREGLDFLGRLLLPTAWVVAVLLLVGRLFEGLGPLPAAALRSLLFLGLVLPLVRGLWRLVQAMRDPAQPWARGMGGGGTG